MKILKKKKFFSIVSIYLKDIYYTALQQKAPVTVLSVRKAI